MKEDRAAYKITITKEITEKLGLDMTKEYSDEEITKILIKQGMNSGILKYKPLKVQTAESIIETLVDMDMVITDAIHNVIGYYEDKSKCTQCNNYFTEERMFQLTVDKEIHFLCETCRRKAKLKISFLDFRRRITEEERADFIQEELESGIDYSDYIERLSKKIKYKYERNSKGVNL